MKLTTLFLSLMLAGSALGAPVPPADSTHGIDSAPGVGNFPTVGSGVVDGVAPGTMEKFNTGIKGGVKQPETEPDHVTDATDAAAVGDAGPAKKLGARQAPGLPPPLNTLVGGATGKRSAGPPSLDHTGISHEINQATSRAGNNRRSPVGPIPGVNAGENANVASLDDVKNTLEGVSKPTRREEKKKCVGRLEDLTHGGVPCVADGSVEKVDPNKLNGVNGAAKDATAGKTETPKTETPKTETPKTETPSTGTETVTGSDLGSEFVPSADSVTASPTDTKTPTKDVKAPTTGDVTGAGDVTGLASGFVTRDVDGTVKEVTGAAADVNEVTGGLDGVKKTTGTNPGVTSVEALGAGKKVGA